MNYGPKGNRRIWEIFSHKLSLQNLIFRIRPALPEFFSICPELMSINVSGSHAGGVGRGFRILWVRAGYQASPDSRGTEVNLTGKDFVATFHLLQDECPEDKEQRTTEVSEGSSESH